MIEQMPGEMTRERELDLKRACEDIFSFVQTNKDKGWEMAYTAIGSPCAIRPGFEVHWVTGGIFQAVTKSSRYRICGNGHTPRDALLDMSNQLVDFRDELNRFVEAL